MYVEDDRHACRRSGKVSLSLARGLRWLAPFPLSIKQHEGGNRGRRVQHKEKKPASIGQKSHQYKQWHRVEGDALLGHPLQEARSRERPRFP